MMQSRRREEHRSSGELDVFGATSYFAGLPPAPDDDCRRPSSATEPPADRLYFQAKVVQRDTTRMTTTEGNSFHGPHQQQQQLAGVHGHAERHASNKQLQVVAAAKRQPSASGKSKLAALLSFVVSSSPSPRAARFRKEEEKKKKKQEAPSTTTRLRQAAEAAEAAAAAAGGARETAANNTYKANSPSSSSRESSSMRMQLQGLFSAHDDEDELDLGVATGDRRLQGITVVRGIGGDEERRWVVRCVPGPGARAWDEEEERREKMLDAAKSASSEQNIKDELVEVEQLQGDGDVDPAHSSWDSDSSSDLFDLDLEYR